MVILKCKMCGGSLEISDDSVIAVCEYCGTKQTVPAADDDRKMSMYGRANKLRYSCDFDKAAGIYESIIAEFPDEAEAYWGLVLCKYGIEYVDDPATGKKIPTCHRSSFDSVFEDENFEMVMENAAPVSVPLYREEAKVIEEIRKGIIEVSSKESPYDIFICYKETDENGDRTVDSLIAQEIYDALTEEGYRVFFSRITLEDKLGTAYEPYIFAALNSAKIMLAVGTSYLNYNAVWVKNEWSRFLQLIGKVDKKVLIPCFKDIDAYDIPKEFKHLQAQNMGKVGALKDLVRGINKLLPRRIEKHIEESRVNDNRRQPVNQIASLLERAYIFLVDHKWTEADNYFEKALDLEPKNEKAYLGKLLVQAKCSNIEELLSSRILFSELDSYKTYLRYSSDKSFLEQIIIHDKEESALRITEKLLSCFEKYSNELDKCGLTGLIHTQFAFEIIEFIKNNPDFEKTNILKQKIENYCCKLDLFSNRNELFIDLNNDNDPFSSWLFCRSTDLNQERKILRTIQEKVSLYYWERLRNGRANARWNPNNTGSLLGVKRNKYHVFANIEEQLQNEFLVKGFYKGIENASKLNSVALGKQYTNCYVFVYGSYAVHGNYEEFNCLKSQIYIDEIHTDEVDACYKEMNELAKNISVDNTKKIFAELGVSIDTKIPFGYFARIKSISPTGIEIELVDTLANESKQINEISNEDIRAIRVLFRKAAGRCQYCGSPFKGVFSKICSNPDCKNEKDYSF